MARCGHRDADRAEVGLKEMDVMAPGRINLSVAEARDLAEGALRGVGFDDEEARIIADHVVDAASSGYASCFPKAWQSGPTASRLETRRLHAAALCCLSAVTKVSGWR